MSQTIPVPTALGWVRKTKEGNSVLTEACVSHLLIEEIIMISGVSMKTYLRVSLSYMQASFLNFNVNSTLKALQDPSELSIFLHTLRSPWHFQGG